MSAPATILFTPADSARAIAGVYTVSLLATLPLGLAAIAALVLRRSSAETRALVWRSAIVALLVVIVGRQLPLQWVAWVVPSFFATPLVTLGRMQVGAASVQTGAGDDVPLFIAALFAVYAVGVLVVLTPTAVAVVRSRRRLRHAVPLDGTWSVVLADICRELGIRRSVRLVADPAARVPMTWGMLWPVVVLPTSALTWSDAQQRIVLLHELAHVRAADWWFQMTGRLVCALLWFHPGAWWVARRLRDDSELACDDRVIASGVRRSDYAELLIDAADALSGAEPPRAAAMALARRRGLRARLDAVLDGRHVVRPLARGWATAAMVATLAVAAPTSVVQLAPTRDVLTSLMNDAQWQSRAYAVLGLAQRADSVAVAVDAAELDPNPRVRAWARYALAQRPAVAVLGAGSSNR